jgi:hypothetical protein
MKVEFIKKYTAGTRPDIVQDAERIQRVYGDSSGLIQSIRKNLGDMCVPPIITLRDKKSAIVIEVTTPNVADMGAHYCLEILKRDVVASGWKLVKKIHISSEVTERFYRPTNTVFLPADMGTPLQTIYENVVRGHNPVLVNLPQQPPLRPMIKSNASIRRRAIYTPAEAKYAAALAALTDIVTADMVKGYIKKTGRRPETYDNLGFGGGGRRTVKHRRPRRHGKTAKNRRHK